MFSDKELSLEQRLTIHFTGLIISGNDCSNETSKDIVGRARAVANEILNYTKTHHLDEFGVSPKMKRYLDKKKK